MKNMGKYIYITAIMTCFIIVASQMVNVFNGVKAAVGDNSKNATSSRESRKNKTNHCSSHSCRRNIVIFAHVDDNLWTRAGLVTQASSCYCVKVLADYQYLPSNGWRGRSGVLVGFC